MTPFSLVFPCYNESKSLAALVERTVACARRRHLTPAEFRMVVVDNGSRDDSGKTLDELRQTSDGEFLHVVRITANQGYGDGIFQGLRACPPGIVGWTHADEQCNPEDAFVARDSILASKVCVLVKGSRYGRSWRERLFSRAFEWTAAGILWRRIHEINAQPKVFDSSLLRDLISPPLDFSFDLYVLLTAIKRGLVIKEIPVVFPPRKHGESRWAATFQSRVLTVGRLVQFMLCYRASPSPRAFQDLTSDSR